MILLTASDDTSLIFFAVCGIASLIIFYFIIKGAVKNGIIEAYRDMKISSLVSTPGTPEYQANAAQVDLKRRYENGQVTFAEYQAEWEKLK